MSEATLQLLLTIRRRLRTALRRRTLADVAFGALVTLGVLGVLLLAGTALEAVLWMGVGLRSLFFWAFVVGALGLVGYFVALPLLRLSGIVPGLDERAAARQAGRRHPAVADRLTALLDLADGRAGAPASPLLDHALVRLGRDVEPVPFEAIEDTARVRRVAPWALGPVLGLLVFFLAAPTTFVGAVDRLFAPSTAFQPPAPFSFAVEPGDVEVVRGEALAVVARPVGTGFPPDALLEWGRTDEEATEEVRLALSEGRFAHTLPNVRADLRYRVTAGGVASPWYRATVVTRPVVRGLQVTLVPPRYTGLPARRLAPGVGDVLALPGTQVRLAVGLGEAPLDSAGLVVEWTGAAPQSVPLTIDGETAEGGFTLRSEGTYRIRLVGEGGRENADPVRYPLATLRDAPPQITLVEGTEAPLSDGARDVRFRITDDFGFARATLYWRLAERPDGPPEEDFQPVALPLENARALDQEILTRWLPRAGARALQPGDVVEFFGEVRDNDAVAGHKPARTPVYTLRYPSLDEQFDRLDETQDETREGLDRLERESDDFRDRFEELREELRRDPQPDWEDRRQLDRLMQQHENLQQQAESLTGQMQEILDQMQEGRLVTEETMRLYEAMQQVMEELDSPELREALEMLRQAMEEMNLQQMMESMEEVEFDEQQFRERMERALELFERLQTAQELDEVARRAEDLAEREEALRENTERLEERQQGEPSEDAPGSEEQRGNDSSENDTPQGERDPAAERERLAREQERAREAMQELEEAMENVQEQMQDQRGAPNEQMQQMMQEMQQQNLPQQMEQNAEQLRQNQLSPAQQGQQQMEQQLRQMSQQMQNMAGQMQGRQQQANIQGLRRVLDDVLTLSEEQERLGDDTGALPSRSPALRPIAQQQVGLADGLATVSDTLSALAHEIPQMRWQIQRITSDALREMGQATGRLADLQPGPASGHQKTAMTHLNDLALMLSELLDQLASGSSGGGGSMSMQQMMQQLQQMGQQQQGLGEQMQQMLNDMAGERLTQSAQQQARQAAARQEALRQQLQELLERGGQHLDAQTRSALQRAAEAMDAAAEELRRGQITREAVQRQQQILQRLLDAERSVNQRGREERREGRTGEDRPNPDRPDRLDLPDDEADRLRRDLIRALESGYAPDYQELIKRYFERLQDRAAGG